MYLTQIKIDVERREARRILGSSQIAHAVIMKACGETSKDEVGRVLWRVDQGSYGTFLYILSPREPEVAELGCSICPPGTSPKTLHYLPFLSRLEKGQKWAFRLAANPVRSTSPDKKDISGKRTQRSKRHAHITVRQQADWLVKRAVKHGFELSPPFMEGGGPYGSEENVPSEAKVRVVRRGYDHFQRKDKEQEKRSLVTVSKAVFEGVLTIVDVEAFRNMLVSGLGPAKAYGCGLMTLAKVQ